MPDLPDPAANSNPPYEEFVRLFVAHEGRLRAFVRALLPSWADVDEVMQETSLVAWRKFGRFERGTSFMAWAATIARFEALDQMRKQGRDQLLFSEAVVDLLAADTLAEADALERERSALERCLAKLEERAQSLAARKLVVAAVRGAGEGRAELAEGLPLDEIHLAARIEVRLNLAGKNLHARARRSVAHLHPKFGAETNSPAPSQTRRPSKVTAR